MAKKKVTVVKEEVKPKLRIKLRAYDNKVVDNSKEGVSIGS